MAEEKKARRPVDPNSAKYKLGKIASDAFADAIEAKKEGKPVAWVSSNFPVEIPETLGLATAYPENQAAGIAARGAGERMCEVAEADGYSNDICAYARISMAYAKLKECPEQDVAMPDVLLCCNNICNCMIKWYENLAIELNIPMILLDIPFNPDYEVSQAEIDYVSAQFWDAVHTLENLFDQIQAGERKELALIVKADVQGSVEAVKASLEKLSNDEVNVRVIHGGVGAINESDVMLAASSGAIIVGFNVRPDAAARDGAVRQNVDMRMYRVIYDCIDEIEAAMKGMLAPKYREVVLGHAEVRQTYKVSGVGTIAGCYVQDGKIVRNCSVRVVRDGIVIHEGHLASLKRFKDDAKEVAENYECGMTVEKFNDIKEGDIIEGYTMEEIPR